MTFEDIRNGADFLLSEHQPQHPSVLASRLGCTVPDLITALSHTDFRRVAPPDGSRCWWWRRWAKSAAEAKAAHLAQRAIDELASADARKHPKRSRAVLRGLQ